MVCAADLGTLPEITIEAFNEAKTLIGYLERTLPDLIRNHIVASQQDKERQKIEAVLQKRGEIKWSELSSETHIFGNQFKNQIDGLVMAGRVELSTGVSTTKPATILKWVHKNGIVTV